MSLNKLIWGLWISPGRHVTAQYGFCRATAVGHQTALPALYKILVLATDLSVNILLLRGVGDMYGTILGGDG